MITITGQQARQFILSMQGLIGQHRFIGKDGAYDYVCQAGCISMIPLTSAARMLNLRFSPE
ncbi:MAG: hypothetical protein K5776_00030 [Lachnospiraceae bacterium]|nr:hypothetical protein [Lachnospiraceae bacterium]